MTIEEKLEEVVRDGWKAVNMTAEGASATAKCGPLSSASTSRYWSGSWKLRR